MDAIGGLLSKVGGVLGGGAKAGSALAGLGDIAKLVTGVMGTISNAKQASRSEAISKQMADYAKQMTAIANNPQELARRALAVRQPLSTGLLEGVGNDVQAQLAERGLGSSPAQAEQILGQTLAPYEQHAQDVAIQAVMQLLGLPVEALGAASKGVPSPADTTGFWKMFQSDPTAGGTGYPIISTPGGYGSTPIPGAPDYGPAPDAPSITVPSSGPTPWDLPSGDPAMGDLFQLPSFAGAS